MKIKCRINKNLKLSNLYMVIIIILLSSCGNKNWDITPDHFNYRNLTEFEVNSLSMDNELVAIKDDKFLEYWYSVLYEGKIDVPDQKTSYFHAWQSRDGSNLKEFTIACKTECDLGIYYVVIDSIGQIVAHLLVASLVDTHCSVGNFYSKTTLTNETTLTRYEYEGWTRAFFPIEIETEYQIKNNGSIISKEPVTLIPSVCLWEKLTIKATPELKGEYITSVVLGEEFHKLGETKIDENSTDKTEYGKVRLSDGTEGWIQTRFIASNARTGAVLKEAFIYKRAEEITKTNNKFEQFDIVGVLERSEDYEWNKVKGKPSNAKWFKEGWVKSNMINSLGININVAKLVKEALKEVNPIERKNKLIEIISNTSFEDSKFIDDVKLLAGISGRLKLKWKRLDIPQYGRWLYFENEKGEEITYSYIDIPDLNSSNNKYFKRYESEESLFGIYKINENIKGKWYWITTEFRQEKHEFSNEIFDIDVIIDIQAVE